MTQTNAPWLDSPDCHEPVALPDGSVHMLRLAYGEPREIMCRREYAGYVTAGLRDRAACNECRRRTLAIVGGEEA